MIGWMQKHNKYLIVTIWVATIAFIGAGFVGWGSYNYGSKSGTIAQVGDVEIPQAKWQLTYQNLYEQYNYMFKGKFDDEQAKKMNLQGQAFNSVVTQAKLLNLANEFGIIVSNQELKEEIYSIRGFQKDGVFSSEIYNQYLKNIRLKASVFEEIVRDDVKINKLFNLLNVDSVDFEQSILASAMNLADKIAYRVITPSDKEININIDEKELKKYWEANKNEYLTPKRYIFDVLWTPTKDTQYSQAELDEYYKNNSFNYIDDNGTQLSLEEAKEEVVRDLKLKKSKKSAQRAYIDFKKNKVQKSETFTLDVNSPKFSKALWEEITKKAVGDILKPKIVDNQYATLKIVEIKEPQLMQFEEAREKVVKKYENFQIFSQMKQIANNTLNNIKDNNVTIISDYLTLGSPNELENLSVEESNQFLSQLFKTVEAKGMITIGNKIIVYNIIDQKLSDNNESNNGQIILDTMNKMKDSDFQKNLLKELDNRYKIKTFVKGL
ncbi:MAG: peptidylprolyl isomerase [Campylobacterales bacterium]|nr:peptidylprolyl isomerase [Campylobacterales bacterium]